MGWFKQVRKQPEAREPETVYSLADVSADNNTAKEIQSNVDLLRYLGQHPHLDRDSLAAYMEMCEQFGMGVNPQKADLLAASARMTPEQATAIRQALAQVHLDALGRCIQSLKAAPPDLHTASMLAFIVNSIDDIKPSFT